MNTLTTCRKKVMPSGITDRDKTMNSRSMNIHINHKSIFQSHFFGFFIILTAMLFSNYAHSANAVMCSPSNGTISSIHIQANIYAPPAGSLNGVYYYDSTPVMMPGPITCPTYTPTEYTALAVNANGVSGWGIYTVDLGQGFALSISIGTTPGFKGGSVGTWLISGNTPNIPQIYYPGFIIFPPSKIANTTDLVIDNLLIEYMAVIGQQGLPSDYSSRTDEMTAIYLSGRIHFPPYCQYQPESLQVTMPAHFASDFSGVSAGATVGTPMLVPGKVTCQGGTTGGDGDLVHMSIKAGFPGDGQYIAGIDELPEVGIKVFDGAGNPLSVDGTEVATMATHRSSTSGVTTGTFDFPLQLQLVSRTGTAPPNSQKSYFSYLTIEMSMD